MEELKPVWPPAQQTPTNDHESVNDFAGALPGIRL